MLDPVILELPYPPSINHYYKYVKTHEGLRVFIGAKGLEFRSVVELLVRSYKNRHKIKLDMPYFYYQRLIINILVYPPDNRVRDLDNPIKAIFDSLQNALVYKNDNQIDELRVSRKEIIKGGKVKVFVSQL